MCLTLAKPMSRKRKRSGYGYKIFRIYVNSIEFELGNLYGSHICPVGEWLDAAPSGSEYPDYNNSYRTGFHIFKSRRSAARYASCKEAEVIKVRYSDAFSEGKQDRYPALVAGRIYVPKSELRRLKMLDLSGK